MDPLDVFPNSYIVGCTNVGYKATYIKASNNLLELYLTAVSIVVTVYNKYFAVALLHA